MQRNDKARGRPRAQTYPSMPPTSYLNHPVKGRGGSEDDVEKSATTRAIGYCDDSNVKFVNQEEEHNLVGVMDRLRAAKSRAKVGRNQETMRIRRDCWILESQRKAMVNSTVAFSDLLRSTRMKNARMAAQAGDAEKTSDVESPARTPPMSPRIHTKLLRWRGITLEAQEASDESSDGSKASSTDTANPRLPEISNASLNQQHQQRFGISSGVAKHAKESDVGEHDRGHRSDVDVLNKNITSGNKQERRQSFHSTLHPQDEQSWQSVDSRATESRLHQAKMIRERALLRRRPKTAAPKLASPVDNSEKDIHEKSPTPPNTPVAVGTPPSSRRRARSMSYMTPGQSSVSACGKVRSVNEKTISLHGRTTRELRKMTHIDNIAAAESEERRKQIEERKKEIKEKERLVLQEKIDDFLKRLNDMTKEELSEKRPFYSGLTESI
ncbi:uncharacterized protein LOC121412597 [Lytechinus variegatus]|uniref:uncharacterized protein LOC121412597 n=1 Tax=Lytechinus variegatus TaxID=7654 RepID=UPI001BB1F332|nr:uncharacterized protein LOC121412597 [Lytechinus variegatus]